MRTNNEERNHDRILARLADPAFDPEFNKLHKTRLGRCRCAEMEVSPAAVQEMLVLGKIEIDLVHHDGAITYRVIS